MHAPVSRAPCRRPQTKGLEAAVERFDPPSTADAEAVEAQLERPPRGTWRVARRCRCGLPQVIETSPRLDDGTPFPTLYWLTCKQLIRVVGTLESSWMAEVNETLEGDATLQEQLGAATDEYIARRDLIEPLDQSGHPGGGPDRVKCLHAHTAHALITGNNPIGLMVLNKLQWEDPIDPCV